MDTKPKKTFRFEIELDYIAGDGRAIAGLLTTLGQSLEALHGQDLRRTDAKNHYFIAELRNESGRVFGRALVSDDDFVSTSYIAAKTPSVVVDANVIVPASSEAGQHEKKMRGDDERAN